MVETSWTDHLENKLAEARGRYDELLERHKALEETLHPVEIQNRRLLAALEALGLPYDEHLCFCGMAVGNPMLSGHTPACQRARVILDDKE